MGLWISGSVGVLRLVGGRRGSSGFSRNVGGIVG